MEKEKAKAHKPVSRREARIAAMHIIFAAYNTSAGAAESAAGVCAVLDSDREQRAANDALAQNILRVFDYRRGDIEDWIAASYGRPLAQMTTIELAIIAAALAENLGYPDTPWRVVLNEAIELAKQFGSEGGSKLVNGILDSIGQRR